MYTVKDLTQVKNCVNGNPRYVIHFLAFVTEADRLENDGMPCYQKALARAKKLIGAKAYKGREYGGGFVFTSYFVGGDIALINKLHTTE